MVDEITLRMKLGLSPTSGQLLSQLLSQQVVVTGDDDSNGVVENAHRVAMHRLRLGLEPHGVSIQSRKKLGYWLTSEDKAKIVEMCGGDMAVEEKDER
jgi:hypothetical protein